MTFPIRPVLDAEFPALFAVLEQAFSSSWPSEPAVELERLVFEADRSLAAFDGGEPVGVAGSFTFELTTPGGITPAAGVTMVSVRPDYRRRGILSALMRRQLADIAGRGEPVAVLFASEAPIYGRFGYGCASEHYTFSFRRGEAGQLAPEAAALTTGTASRRAGSAEVRLRIVPAGDAIAAMTPVYDTVRAGRPGMYARDERWWRLMTADPEFAREGHTPLRALVAAGDGGPEGYALYRVKPGHGDDGLPASTLTIAELFAVTPAATAALWRDLLSRDLVSEVRARLRPVDDPVLALLADRERARPQMEPGIWVRLVDVPAALARRRYACPVDMVLEVSDELLAGNAARWRLQAGGPDAPAPARCERTDRPADLALSVRALGSAYLGGTRLGALAAAGHIREIQPGSAARLSHAMLWDPAPWCPSIF